MQDHPDVRLVDAHAKGHGGDHHLHLVAEEHLVGVLASSLTHAGVVHRHLSSLDDDTDN